MLAVTQTAGQGGTLETDSFGEAGASIGNSQPAQALSTSF